MLLVQVQAEIEEVAQHTPGLGDAEPVNVVEPAGRRVGVRGDSQEGRDVAERQQGQSGWSLRSLLALSLTALVSFTSAPLRVVSVLGVLTFILAAVVGSDAIVSWYRGEAVSGFATITITLLLIGSFIMISLGVIGEYIAKIYDETKRRPAFLIERVHENGSKRMPSEPADSNADS